MGPVAGSAGLVDFVRGPLCVFVRPSAWVHRRPFNSLCRAVAVRAGTIDSCAGLVLVVRGRSVRYCCLIVFLVMSVIVSCLFSRQDDIPAQRKGQEG